MDMTEIRLKEYLGIVASDASTTQLSFFITPLKGVSVRRGDYVIVDHPTLGELCPLLVMVKEIKNYEEIVGTTLGEKRVKTMTIGDIEGYVDLRDPKIKPLRRLLVPPNPGSKVYLPYREFLEDVFCRDLDGRPFKRALHVGRLESSANDKKGVAEALNFYLNGEDFTRQHFLVTAVTGAGKTHTATVIVEELANRMGYPIVVFDPHGEYATVGVAGKRLKELGVSLKKYPFDFKVSIYACNYEEAIKDLKFCGLEPESEAGVSLKPVKGQWMGARDEEARIEIKQKLEEEVKVGRVTVFNAKGLSPEERTNLFTHCAQVIYDGRVGGSIEPLVMVIEEAENLAGSAPKTLENIASEGRKIGVSMCLLCQHPTEMSEKVLSQMGAQIMGRTTDPKDLEYLKNTAQEKASFLPNLRTGEWIINGITVRQPTVVHVRDRYSLAMKT